MTVEEFAFDIAGVCIAGRRWRNSGGAADARPVLALHGWLDNAASFDQLAPLLDGADVVAVDLAGHGLSYHRPPQAAYNVWDDLPDLLRLADHLGWLRFHLIGHSRGAIIAALLAAALPERVESLVLLDGLAPETTPPERYFDQLGNHVREHLAATRRVATTYPDVARALQVRCRVAGISERAARPIVERGLRITDSGVQWRADPRLHLPSAVRLSPLQVDELKRRLGAASNTLLIAAADGLARQLADDGELTRADGIERVVLPGSHHFHLEEAAPEIARLTLQWWQRCDARAGLNRAHPNSEESDPA
jgi:pimeloyl-ACP methyl ester carboxylesterase